MELHNYMLQWTKSPVRIPQVARVASFSGIRQLWRLINLVRVVQSACGAWPECLARIVARFAYSDNGQTTDGEDDAPTRSVAYAACSAAAVQRRLASHSASPFGRWLVAQGVVHPSERAWITAAVFGRPFLPAKRRADWVILPAFALIHGGPDFASDASGTSATADTACSGFSDVQHNLLGAVARLLDDLPVELRGHSINPNWISECGRTTVRCSLSPRRSARFQLIQLQSMTSSETLFISRPFRTALQLHFEPYSFGIDYESNWLRR